MVPQAYGKYYISLIEMYKGSNVFLRAPGRRGRGAIPRGAGWPTLPAPLVLRRFSSCRPVRALGWRGRGRPQGLGLAVANYLRTHTIGNYLCSHTYNYQLFMYVGASAARSNWSIPPPPPCRQSPGPVRVGAVPRGSGGRLAVANYLCGSGRLHVHTQ